MFTTWLRPYRILAPGDRRLLACHVADSASPAVCRFSDGDTQVRVHRTKGDRAPSPAPRSIFPVIGVPVAMASLLSIFVSICGCGKPASPGASGDGAVDAVAVDAGLTACPEPDGGSPAGVADDFGPNAKALAASSALGQLDVYEVTAPRQLEWVDLYLRAELDGTRVTISVYEAAARNAIFRRRAMIQIDVPPCSGWVGSGPLAVPLEAGRFYAIGYDPNQAITAFVDSESSNLPVDGQFGRLIGSKTSTSVSLDTLDWGAPSDKSFTRQRIFTSARAAGDAGADAPAGGGDAAADAASLADAAGG